MEEELKQKPNKEEVEKQLHRCYSKSALFFGLGWAAIGVGVLAFVAMFMGMGFFDVSGFASLIFVGFGGGIALFILDGVLWKRKARIYAAQLKEE